MSEAVFHPYHFTLAASLAAFSSASFFCFSSFFKAFLERACRPRWRQEVLSYQGVDFRSHKQKLRSLAKSSRLPVDLRKSGTTDETEVNGAGARPPGHNCVPGMMPRLDSDHPVTDECTQYVRVYDQIRGR
eukprot:765398-Hanusia_phi.AAC.6